MGGRPVAETPIEIRQDSFAQGIDSRVSTTGKRQPPPSVKDAQNFRFRPHGAMTLRPGSRDIASVSLPEKPTSLGKLKLSGTSRLYVGTDDGLSGGHIYRLTTTGRTAQTLAAGFTASDQKWRFEQANGILIACQRDNAGLPQFDAADNAADTWLSLALPKPAAAITFSGANTSPGNLTDAKTYYWRHRWRYRNGSSLAGPVSAGRLMATPNLTANLAIPVPGSPRPDYLGWTLERTDGLGDATGPFYWVVDGTAATYADAKADSQLGYRSDETLHGEPPAMDGVILHKGRLFGWRGSTVYLSNLFEDEEGTGLANWVGDNTYFLSKDDGDTIVGCVRQGDRLLFGKRTSLHVIEGDDIDSFRPRRIFDGAGFCGPRAACSIGPTVLLCAGNGRLFEVRGDQVKPWLSKELGDQLKEMNPTYDDDVLAVNWRGQEVRFGHRRRTSDAQRDWLGWDLEFGTPIRDVDPPAIDALLQKDTADFGGASLLLADPVLRAPVVTTSPSQNPSFFAWKDERGASSQFYVQSLDNLGAARWAANGLQASLSSTVLSSTTSNDSICGDGAGGTIIAFVHHTGVYRQIRAQRYNAAGAALWAAGGVLVCDVSGVGAAPGRVKCIADGVGGALVGWGDSRPNGFGDANGYDRAYVQRLDAATGAPVAGWPTNGVKVYDATSWSNLRIGVINMLPYGSGGAWIAVCGSGGRQVYQRVDGAGALLGSAAGDSFGLVYSTGNDLAMARDSSGNVFFLYQTTSTGDVFVKKYNSSAVLQWTANLSAGNFGSQLALQIVSDGAGGCIAAWENIATPGTMVEMRAMRVGSAGVLAWAAGGIPLSTPGVAQTIGFGSCVMDGSGGAIFSWYNNVGKSFAQKINAAGTTLWGPNGITLYGGAQTCIQPQLSTDGAGGCIAAMFFSNTDVKAQRVKADGTLPWGALGIDVVTAANQQAVHRIAFTDTPEAEYPPTATAGYHVWSAFEGLLDLRAVDGSGGQSIRGTFQIHRCDSGLPRYVKDYDAAELIVNRGSGVFAITVDGDPGVSATLALETTAIGFRVGDGTTVGSAGCVCAITGEAKIDTGLPPNTEGRSASITVAGDFTDEVEIGGVSLRGIALPGEVYS